MKTPTQYIVMQQYEPDIVALHREFEMQLWIDYIDSDRSGQTSYFYYVITPTGAIFIGKQYRPSILWKEETQILDGLLSYICLRPGDTDSEYFDDYTPEQMEWAQSRECEEAYIELEMAEEEEYYGL